MKWMVTPLAVIFTLIAIVWVIGWLLPVAHEASRSGYVDKGPQQVYEIIVDVPGYAKWLENTTRVEVVDAVPPARVVTRVADPDQPFGGTWTFTIVPEGTGSRVTITEHGEVYNPIFRFMARFVFGYAGTMDAFLRNLAAAATSSR